MRVYVWLFLSYSCLLFSCAPLVSTSFSNNCNTFFEFGKPKKVSFLLAHEECPLGTNNFCGGIFFGDSNIGMQGLFVVLDTFNYINSYDTIYQFTEYGLEADELKKKGIDFVDWYDVNDMFVDSLAIDSVRLNSKYFDRKLRRYSRRHGFDVSNAKGRFVYKIYDVDATVIRAGVREIFLPNLEKSGKDFIEHCSVVYYILDVKVKNRPPR